MDSGVRRLMAATTRSAAWVVPESTTMTPAGPTCATMLLPAPPMRKKFGRSSTTSSAVSAGCCAVIAGAQPASANSATAADQPAATAARFIRKYIDPPVFVAGTPSVFQESPSHLHWRAHERLADFYQDQPSAAICCAWATDA